MRQIAAIQNLRALAALMVVVGHAQSAAAVASAKAGASFAPLPLLPWGAGVDLFFVISGFIMVVASERLFAAPGGAQTFFARRLKRIVPLYWLATTLYVAIHLATHKPIGGADVAASYLFWPRDVFGDGVPRPIYTLGWTLNYEMFFYALFATAIALPRRACVATVTGLLVAGVAIGRLVALPPGPLAFWTQPIVLEFALGMWLGLAWRADVRIAAVPRALLAALGVAALAWDTMGSARQAVDWMTPNDLARLAGWGVPAAAVVAAAVLGHRGEPRAAPSRWGRCLDFPPALGDASYALYLVHPFVVGIALRLWSLSGLARPLGYWPFVGAALAASVFAAFVIHRRIELPLARGLALRRLDGKRVLAEPGAS